MLKTYEEALETKEGFKKTKIGWIPKDWDVVRLGDVGETLNGLTYSPKDIHENGVLVLRSSNVQNRQLEFKDNVYVNVEEDKFNPVKENDILICVRNGSRSLIGKNALIDKESEGLAFGAFMSVYRSELNKFFFHLFDTDIYNKEVHKNLGATINSINGSDLRKFTMPLPPEKERVQIASILSDWDKAVENTQTLVDKLLLHKKGLIQELLTGRTRLAGFSDEWQIIKAGDLFENYTDKNHDGTLEVLSATQDKGVIPRSETGIDIKYDPKSLKNYKRLDVGDFVISLRSFQGGIEFSNYEGLVSPAYTVLREKLPISKVFYKEYMKTQSFINKLNSMIYGIRDGKQISYKEFSTMKILYPSVEEQKAIASVIEIADKEINQYQSYLEQLITQKKGLMQQLLTGKIRVKVN